MILLAGVAAALPLVTRHFGLPGFAIAYAIAVALWFIARRMAASLRGALIIAALVRVSFLFTDPVLSGDVFRYLWDGRVLTAGVNPYAAAPDDARFERLREPWHSRINHPEIRTIYPPLAEILFAAAPGLVSWRLMLIIADLVTIRLLRRRPELLLGVALFPPMLIETAWSAHVEAIAAMLLLTSTLHDSGAAAGAAVGIKIIPIAALPALLRRSAHRVRFIAAATVAIAIPALPFLFGSHFMSGMREYATRWIFNSPLDEAIYFLAGQTHSALRLKGIFSAIKDPLHLEGIAPFVYAHLYSDFLTRCALGVLAVVAILVLARATGKVSDGVGALLLCSPAIHPWYWLVLAPVAMWESRRLWIGFALFAPMSYLLYAKSAAQAGGATRILVYMACYAMPVIIARLRPSANAT